MKKLTRDRVVPTMSANNADDSRLLQSHDLGFRDRRRCRHATGLSGQASLAAKLSRAKDGDDRLLPVLGNNGHLQFASFDEK